MANESHLTGTAIRRPGTPVDKALELLKKGVGERFSP